MNASPTRNVPMRTMTVAVGSAALFELRFDDGTARRGPRIRLQLKHLGLKADHLEQIVDAGPLGGADRDSR